MSRVPANSPWPKKVAVYVRNLGLVRSSDLAKLRPQLSKKLPGLRPGGKAYA